MSRVLVVYYSWTGHTRQIAEAVAGDLGADVEEIREVKVRDGWRAYFRSTWEVLRGKAVPIEPLQKNPSSYDLVVIGTPVWVGRMASPVRAYIDQQWPRLNRVALFCTQGGTDGEKTLKQVAELSGKRPLATMVISEAELKSGMWRRKVAAFVKRLGHPA